MSGDLKPAREPIIIWETPPARLVLGRKGKYWPILQAIKQRPNEWGRIATLATMTRATNLAHSLRSGKSYAVLAQPGRFDAVSRRIDAGSVGVWVRWVPK